MFRDGHKVQATSVNVIIKEAFLHKVRLDRLFSLFNPLSECCNTSSIRLVSIFVLSWTDTGYFVLLGLLLL